MKHRKKQNRSGCVMMVLHAHLPYVRSTEHEHFLEERWFFEAVTETYIPLLETLVRLVDDGVDFGLTMSLTPTLLEMFSDDHLIGRYKRHLDCLIELSEREVSRTRRSRTLGPVARMYSRKFTGAKETFEKTFGCDLASAFSKLAASGKVELITCAATHAYLPILLNEPSSLRAQVFQGMSCFERTLQIRPSGIWLPECGYAPGVAGHLVDAGVKFSFLESHGLLNVAKPLKTGIYAPVSTPEGLTVFARDAESSREVWSAAHGYPGDPYYRDFYTDIGFELEMEYLKPFLAEGIRTFTGLKYRRVTGGNIPKKPYDPAAALRKAGEHAAHFISCREKQAEKIRAAIKRKPVITAAYDAELFGHWWFEGPEWLDLVLRQGAKSSVGFVLPSEYLADNPAEETVSPSASSWGELGYSSTWINPSNEWLYKYLLRACRMMKTAALQNKNATGSAARILNQAGRELMLAQASDWAFMIKNGNTAEFASEKIKEHLANFFTLLNMLHSGRTDSVRLASLERKNNIFGDLDFKLWLR